MMNIFRRKKFPSNKCFDNMPMLISSNTVDIESNIFMTRFYRFAAFFFSSTKETFLKTVNFGKSWKNIFTHAYFAAIFNIKFLDSPQGNQKIHATKNTLYVLARFFLRFDKRTSIAERTFLRTKLLFCLFLFKYTMADWARNHVLKLTNSHKKIKV